MLSKDIKFKNFNIKSSSKKIKNDLYKILKEDNEILNSLRPTYKYSYNKKLIKKLKKENVLSIIGMGGSVLGTQAIYHFLKHKIKKTINFHDNLESNLKIDQKNINIIVSKSGNTLETITNANLLLKSVKTFL